jgi:Holliday junction resolvase
MYCGEWVLNSYKTKEDKIYKESDELEQVIFSYAKEFKLEKWIEYDESSQKYFPTILMEETGSKFPDKYKEKQRRL